MGDGIIDGNGTTSGDRMTPAAVERELARQYRARKQWVGQGDFMEMAEIFRIETNRTGVKPGDRLLEIGFGDGLFLDWAAHNGFEIHGVEINPDFVRQAEERGHTVFLGDARQVPADRGVRYQGIFLFDVMEHLSLAAIHDLLSFLATVLADTGRILVRVPNGGSPFGRYLQNGDATHQSILTAPRLQDIGALCGLTVLSAHNGARTLAGGAHRHPVLKRLAYLCRDLIQRGVGYLYFGENIPLDPNLTVIMGHAPHRHRGENGLGSGDPDEVRTVEVSFNGRTDKKDGR